MKILRIRFQNLNSLNGLWEIDFATPAYTENSLFAITGPTGAGKSTILDALCLALYGATPRLGKITKSSNQIMSRHRPVCFAEVEFATTKGQFRCHWSQHRSRQQSHGELQQPRHEICDALTNKIIESKIRNVASKIEEVTGMDFDRFTRSTLLAQGGFAAFLQASANERSPILEQLTGTAIYSRLSIKVHERYLQELHALEELEHLLPQLELLPPEEEAQLQERAAQQVAEIEKLQGQIVKIRTHLHWTQDIQQLVTEHQGYQSQLAELEEQKRRSAQTLAPLEAALAAKELEPPYRNLTELERRQDLALQKVMEFQKISLSQEGAQLTLGHSRAAAERHLHGTEQARKEGIALIREVSTLDTNLESTTKRCGKEGASLERQRGSLQKEGRALDTLHQELRQGRKEQKVLEKFFTDHAQDGQLLSELGPIAILVEGLETLKNKEDDLASKWKAARREQLKREKEELQLTATREGLKDRLTAAGKGHLQLQEEIQQLLKGKTTADLQQALIGIQKRRSRLHELARLLNQDAQNREQTSVLETKKTTLLQKLPRHKELLATAHKTGTHKSQEIQLLEKNLLLLSRIQTLEQDREQLHEGAPCPLCGACTHPYRNDRPPKPSQEETQLTEARHSMQKIEQDIAQQTRQKDNAEHGLEALEEQLIELARQGNTLNTEAEELLSSLELPPLSEIERPLLQQEAQGLQESQRLLEQDVERLQGLEEDHKAAAKEQEELNTRLHRQDKEQLQARHLFSVARAEVQRLSLQREQLSVDQKEDHKILNQKLRTYGDFSVVPHHLSKILEELQGRLGTWQLKKETAAKLSPGLIKLDTEYTQRRSSYTTQQNQITDQEVQYAATQKDKGEIRQRRIKLFGHKETTAEERSLERNVAQARKTLEGYQEDFGALDKECVTTTALQMRLQHEIAKRTRDISNLRKQFDQDLDNSIFSSTKYFCRALLAPDELKNIQNLQATFQERETRLRTLTKEKKARLHNEQARQLCQETIPELTLLLQQGERQLQSLLETSIGAKERLKRNSTDKIKATAQLRAVATQKEKEGRWKRLHMLIGSADGKKFRNFAQGLTFEMMVHHANRHLNKISDRYILVRDTSQPLDLNVIDTYQADEVRTTQNLSGGESFLVSLALALGLSQMASQNIRVDSLFLDEGFGSLDEETLQSALETLGHLRKENKLIGIISHVSALKERIPLQIEVIPRSHGRSILRGPGVTGEGP